jgi:hypothetical protein
MVVLPGAVPERARVGTGADHRVVGAVRLPGGAGGVRGRRGRAYVGVLQRGAGLPVGVVPAAVGVEHLRACPAGWSRRRRGRMDGWAARAAYGGDAARAASAWGIVRGTRKAHQADNRPGAGCKPV